VSSGPDESDTMITTPDSAEGTGSEETTMLLASNRWHYNFCQKFARQISRYFLNP